MFTGIVEEIGRLRRIDRRGDKIEIEIAADKVLEGTKIGDSIDTNGVCLTVTRLTDGGFCADMMKVTAEKSGLDRLRGGAPINLERALLPTTRMGGHILQGHVDTRGILKAIEAEEGGYLMTVEVEPRYFPYFVPQGSVGLNGVSLTVARAGKTDFSVSLIPETLRSTNLSSLKPGDGITVEFDIVGKYLLRQEEWKEEEQKREIDADFLRRYGF